MLTRRDFTALIGGAAASVALPGCLSPVRDGAYSVSVLGDMHYDVFPPERYHAAAIAKWKPTGAHPARLKEFERNARMWQDICGRILASSSACVRPDAAFALQLGDLVQGDCESDELHRQMLSEATGLLEKAYPNLPVVSVCGNHDIREGDRDEGAAEAYAAFMRSYESRQLRTFLPQGVRTTTFGFRCGPDLWIALDFNFGRRDAGIVRRLLAENGDARHTFVVTHGPVLPMAFWRCRWFYLGGCEDAALRREMRALFAKRQAIVLAGHAHSLELKDWYGDGGRITETVLNTCAGMSDGHGYFPAEPDVDSDDPADYGKWAFGPDAAKLGPHSRPAKNAPDMATLFDEYRPGLRRYFAARAVGHHVLRVTDDAVELDYYGRDARTPTRTFSLR